MQGARVFLVPSWRDDQRCCEVSLATLWYETQNLYNPVSSVYQEHVFHDQQMTFLPRMTYWLCIERSIPWSTMSFMEKIVNMSFTELSVGTSAFSSRNKALMTVFKSLNATCILVTLTAVFFLQISRLSDLYWVSLIGTSVRQ